MEFSNELRPIQRISLFKVVLISAVVLTTLIFLFFFFTGMLNSKESWAASATIPVGTSVSTNGGPFSSLNSGDTLFVYGELNVNKDYTTLSAKAITIIVDGSSATIKIHKDKLFELGAGSSILLRNGGTISSTGGCTNNTRIVFGGVEMANCPGVNGLPSFADLNSNGGLGSAGMLPVSWLDVDAQMIAAGEVEVFWSTASEENNSHFIIEYSEDGDQWLMVNRVNSKAVGGNSLGILEYSELHYLTSNTDIIHYRIKQVDYDEKSDYSPVVSLHNQHTAPLKIATLGNARIGIYTESSRNQEAEVRVFDQKGSVVYQGMVQGSGEIQLPQTGWYVIESRVDADVQRVKHMVL